MSDDNINMPWVSLVDKNEQIKKIHQKLTSGDELIIKKSQNTFVVRGLIKINGKEKKCIVEDLFVFKDENKAKSISIFKKKNFNFKLNEKKCVEIKGKQYTPNFFICNINGIKVTVQKEDFIKFI